MKIENAIITDTMLGREDHGILTFMLYVDLEAGSCGIGGYALDYYDIQTKKRCYSAKSAEAVSKVLDIVGVNTWENLKGKYIRVKTNGWGEPIYEIGNILEDKWFNLKEFFKVGE